MHHKSSKLRFLILAFVLAVLLVIPLGISTGYSAPIQVGQLEKPPDDDYPIAYEDIYPRLKEIAKGSNRVKLEVIGQSAGGRDMFLVTLSDPQAMGRLGHYQRIRKLMLEDPEAAQLLIEELDNFKVPFFINASIHGDEKPGVDAAIRLIETLAYEDTPDVQAILENVILLVNVVANPDGRVSNTRSNANGFDLNRDFITQSQPETRAMVKVITEWNPMVLLDLHGFYNPMLIEPCTPLHNPNYEYDLYIQWAYAEALAMEAELEAQTGFSAQIPFRDNASGWDDWPPTYTPMYAMYHGAYGHTLETPYRDQRGVDAHYAAVWGALKFVSINRLEMIEDQIEIFRRGFLDLDQEPISVDWLEENNIPHDQYNEWVVKEFPTAYIIPKGSPGQINDHQVTRIVDFLLENDVQVEKAVQDFNFEGVIYPAGTYIVWMDQPKRGLANTILERGPDMSEIEGISFYSPPSVWSNLLLWGGSEIIVEGNLEVETISIKYADSPKGSVEVGIANAYAYLPANLNAFRATNDLLNSGETIYRLTQSATSGERTFTPGTLILPADPELAKYLATTYALEIYALQSFPQEVDELGKQQIAVVADADTEYALGRLGFDYESLSQGDLNSGAIDGYDVLINQSVSWSNLGKPGRASINDFIIGGGDYIGLGTAGIGFAVDAGILDIAYASNSGNAIVEVTFEPEDSVAAGFRELDYAFVYSPVWFSVDEDENVVDVSARLVGDQVDNDDDFLISGYWPGWQDSGAEGMPVVIHSSTSEATDAGEVSLIGLDITFRGHPENTFRLLGNAIFE